MTPTRLLLLLLLTAALTIASGQDTRWTDDYADESEEEDEDKWENDLEQRCMRIGGRKAWEKAEVARDDFQTCLEHYINISQVEEEASAAAKTGDLDQVFSHYCGLIPDVRNCAQNLVQVLRGCLNDEEQPSLNISLDALDAALDFVCYKQGEHIAIFMAEKGPECWRQKQDSIQDCINRTVGESSDWAGHLFLFNETLCESLESVQKCAVSEMEKCNKPAPADLVDSLMNVVSKATPCWERRTSHSPVSTEVTSVSVMGTLLLGALWTWKRL